MEAQSYTAEELVGADKTVPNVIGLGKDAAYIISRINGFTYVELTASSRCSSPGTPTAPLIFT